MNGRMQRLLVWGLSLQCAAALTATARLDETEEQSRQRYGEPMAKETDPLTYAPMIEGAVHHTYKYQGWRMQAAFVEGKTVRISYMKIGGKNDRPTIQDAEVLAILESEAGGGKWRRKTTRPYDSGELKPDSVVQGTECINTNGNTARFEMGRMMMTLESPAAAAFIKARDAASEQQRKGLIPKF